MSNQNKVHVLDRYKLLENSLSSIRLGMKDYKIATDENGDPARALSSLRNLHSGILLLFKYRISLAGSSPEDAAALIYKTSKALPSVDVNGQVTWKPQYQDNTIDIEDIKVRFKILNINYKFDLVDKIRRGRNEIEHLHPRTNLGELTTFVAELFPVVRDFIEKHLHMTPTELLEGSWLAMLNVHNFYNDTKKKCHSNWENCGIPKLMLQYIDCVFCDTCASSLITPTPELLKKGLTVIDHPDEFTYSCLECGSTDLITPLLFQALSNDYPFDPFDGGPSRILTCIECEQYSYVTDEDVCFWCDYEKTYDECLICHTSLSIDEQEFNGLCSYHAYAAAKDD